jgi:hypothetical protein
MTAAAAPARPGRQRLVRALLDFSLKLDSLPGGVAMLVKILGALALFGVIFAPLAMIFTQTSVLALALYTAVVEAILAMLLIVLIDVFGWHRNDKPQAL